MFPQTGNRQLYDLTFTFIPSCFKYLSWTHLYRVIC